MSHHVYHTRGIILSSTSSGESNRFYKIFTEELGLIAGVAQSVRVGKSKLRYTLQDFSHVTVDLVRGKEVWRIISAGAYNPLETIKKDSARLKLLSSFCSLLLRLLHGEGRDRELFDEIISVANFLETQTIPQELSVSFEILAALRVLTHLGYINKAGYEDFLTHNVYTIDILHEFEKIHMSAYNKINDALNASHL